MGQFKTPILIIGFNRPNHIKQLLESVRKIQPDNLYVFCDGPRFNVEDDKRKCLEVQNIVYEYVDWECKLNTKFSDQNFGCGKGPTFAINWFFEQVDEGIILEDDSIPNNDFYYYIQDLLLCYRNNKDVMAIVSSNFQPKKRSDGSYYFSMQNGCFCSWGTWKRAWSTFDYYLRDVTEEDLKKALQYYNVTNTELKYWMSVFREVKQNRCHDTCWDYQFIFAIWLNNGKTIVPNFNLASNIGFDSEATHTVDPNDPTANKLTQSILPIIHPTHAKISRAADLYYHKFYYQPDEFGYKWVKKMTSKKYRASKKSFIAYNRKVVQKILIKIFPELSKLKNSAYNFETIMSYTDNTLQGKNIKLGSVYRFNNVQIGDFSYVSQNSQISNTKIGKFCSIGPNFFCGWGIHPINGISTSPMFYSTKKQNGITLSELDKIEERKDIIIGNDVFIGANVTVLDGITIGHGAIIGAGSVVSKDIPPYAIAVGSPIQIIKFRFEQKQINALLNICWWEFPDDKLQDVEKMFFDIDAFIEKYAN